MTTSFEHDIEIGNGECAKEKQSKQRVKHNIILNLNFLKELMKHKVYGVYISKFIRYCREFISHYDFLDKWLMHTG